MSKTSRVVLQPTITEPLSSITVCLQVYTDNINRDSLFKLANNSIVHFHLYNVNEYYNIEIDKDVVYFKGSKENLDKFQDLRLICVSWESKTGLIHFVVNGHLFPRRVLKPGFLIDPFVTAVLGQDLDLSSFSSPNSYVGEIRQVNMWDRALHPNEMKLMYHNDWYRRKGNIIDWESVDYKIFGDIFLYKP